MIEYDPEKENLHVEKRKENEAPVKVLKWIKCTSSNVKRALEKEKVLFWWEIFQMLVGHNTDSNSLLSSDSIKNLKLWINALSESCAPDVTFITSIFRTFYFTPLSYLSALPFNSMDRHPPGDDPPPPSPPASTRRLGQNPWESKAFGPSQSPKLPLQSTNREKEREETETSTPREQCITAVLQHPLRVPPLTTGSVTSENPDD